MIADSKRTGGESQGVGIAHYMLDPNAKNDPDGTQYAHGERVLQIHTECAFPILKGSSPKEAAKRFMQQVSSWNRSYRANNNMPQDAWEHMVVSFHPDDSEKVGADKAISIAQEALKNIAPGKRPALYVAHGDKDHLHVHMLYSTVNDQGKIHNLHRDYRAWEFQMERLELKYELHRVENRKALSIENSDLSRMPDGINPSSREYQMTKRTGEVSCKQKLRSLVAESVALCQTEPQDDRFGRFMQALEERGVKISGNIQSSGRVAGVRFHYGIFEKHGIKASSLGRDYSWPKLSQLIGFNNEKNQVKLLTAADYRIEQWTKSSQAKRWGGRVCSAISSSNHSAIPAGLSPGQEEIPDYLPEYQKRYLRALAHESAKETQRIWAKIKLDSDQLHQKLMQVLLQYLEQSISYQIQQNRQSMEFKH